MKQNPRSSMNPCDVSSLYLRRCAMPARKSLLDRIQIPSPCPANWDEMNGSDQIRFCSECNKYVYNLSEMTRREAEALIARHGGLMCARLSRDLNGVTQTADMPPPIRLLSWWPGPISSAVVSTLISIAPGVSALAHSQQAPSQSSYSVGASGHKARRSVPGGATAGLTGVVSDENGTPLSGAMVTVTTEATGEVLAQLTSEEGE